MVLSTTKNCSTHLPILGGIMSTDLLISQLRLGKNGNSIMAILDALCDDSGSSESSQDDAPVITKKKTKVKA